MLPPGWPALSLTTGDAFNQTSFALSLLLVFRTNSSYSRWEEARKAWGQLANRARDFARQVQNLPGLPHRALAQGCTLPFSSLSSCLRA